MFKQLMIGAILFGSSLMSKEFEVRLSKTEKNLIHEIVELISDVEDANFMEIHGQIIPKIMGMMSVPPLEIIAEIALDNSLREKFLKVIQSPVKWSMVIKGFSMRMNQEVLSIDFEEKMEDFLRYFSLEGNEVKEYIERKEWGHFINTILNSIKN